MQIKQDVIAAIGMANDHLTTCYRHAECAELALKE